MGGYIGNEPTTGHFPVDNFTSSGGSTYTLSKAPGSAGAIEVSVQGVLQPTTAYTVSGTTLTMAGVTSGVKIFVRHLGETLVLPTPADGTVTATKLGVNSVDGTKIAMGSDARGDILYHGASDYTRLAKGTSGQVLTMGANDPAWAAGGGTAGQVLTMNSGATAPEWADAAGGGSLELIQTIVANNSSSLDFTTFSSNTQYDIYLITVANIYGDNNGPNVCWRGGAGSFNTNGVYRFHNAEIFTGNSSFSGQGGNGHNQGRIVANLGNAETKAMQADIWIAGMNSSGRVMKVHGNYHCIQTGSDGIGGFFMGQLISAGAATYDRFQIYPSAGTFTSGRATLYGFKHS